MTLSGVLAPRTGELGGVDRVFGHTIRTVGCRDPAEGNRRPHAWVSPTAHGSSRSGQTVATIRGSLWRIVSPFEHGVEDSGERPRRQSGEAAEPARGSAVSPSVGLSERRSPRLSPPLTPFAARQPATFLASAGRRRGLGALRSITPSATVPKNTAQWPGASGWRPISSRLSMA